MRTPARDPISSIKAEFEKLEAASPKPAEGKHDGPKIAGKAVAGRVLANRKMGKAVFLDVFDETGKVQVYLNAKSVGDAAMAVYEQIDLGDFIYVKGDVQRTRTGEVTLFAAELKFLTKALAVPPLPRTYRDESGKEVTHDAFTDTELRYRKRYLDLMVHADVRSRLNSARRCWPPCAISWARRTTSKSKRPCCTPFPAARARGRLSRITTRCT